MRAAHHPLLPFGAALHLVRRVYIFQLLLAGSGKKERMQFRCELALRFNGFDDDRFIGSVTEYGVTIKIVRKKPACKIFSKFPIVSGIDVILL